MPRIVDVNCGDKAYSKYGEFIDKNDAIKFDDDDLLDDLFFWKCSIQNLPELVQIAMIIFTINHGQADIERGFSFNSSVISVNIKEHFMKNKHIVRDHMQKHNLQPSNIEIKNKLKNSCRAAYQH